MRHYIHEITGYKSNTVKHRLKSLQDALKRQGYISTAKLTEKGKPYLRLNNGYRVIFFGSSRMFKLANPKGNMLAETFYGNGWTVAEAIVQFLKLSKDIYETSSDAS